MRNLWVLLFVGALIFPAGWAEAEGNKLSLSELRAQRKEMAQRKRRIIYNNDGDDIGGHGGSTPGGSHIDTPEGLLKLRTTAIEGSQVDSIFYHSTFGMKIFFEDGAFKTIYEYPDWTEKGFATRNCKALIANYGKDALDIMVDFGHKHGLEVFYSNRMNDTHDWYDPEILSYIKVRHPEYTIGHARAAEGTSPAETLKLMRKGRGPSTALNFELPAIRDLTVEAMRQVCRNYDIDGIELDYFRSWALFGTDPVGLEQTAQLNDMMRKMRQMTEEEGLRRGRPILIAARCINDPNYALRFGYDLKTWLQEDLIDILMPLHISGHQGPLKPFIELAHHYDVPAYPCLRRVSREDVGPHGTTWEVCRGEAMSRFVEGADGITTFNRFDPTHQRWSELGDPKVLRDLDKTYTCPQDLPVTVTDRRTNPLRLLVGDDVRSTPPADKRRVLKLRVHVAGLTAEHGFQVELNGRTLKPAKISPALGDSPQEVWFTCSPEPTNFQVGENLVTARLKHADGTVTIDDLGLDVLYVD